MFVCPDNDLFSRSTWNGGHGNKVLNLFAVAKYADVHGFKPVLPLNYASPFFNFSDEWVPSFSKGNVFEVNNVDPFSVSLFGFNISTYAQKFLPSQYFRNRILTASRNVSKEFFMSQTGDVLLSGFFFSAEFEIDHNIFTRFFTIDDLYEDNFIWNKFGFSDNTCVIHIRGTDFIDHLSGVFRNGISLGPEYYRKAIDLVSAFAGCSLDIVVVSDDRDHVDSILDGIDFRFLDGSDLILDWHALRIAPMRIESNSSFCWTASCVSRETKVSVFPRSGYGCVNGTCYPTQFHIESFSRIPL